MQGNTIQAKHLGQDILVWLRNLIGGETSEYTEMLTDARQVALDRMVAEAKWMGANAVVNVRFSTAQVMQAAAEILAYGTAVVVE
ncbi:MAG: YbjQ family protein [Bacillota bacterium]